MGSNTRLGVEIASWSHNKRMNVYSHQAEDKFVKFSMNTREDCSIPIESMGGNYFDFFLI